MFCPRHGCELQYVRTQPDVAASHDIYHCEQCRAEWEWTEFSDGKVIMATGEAEDIDSKERG